MKRTITITLHGDNESCLDDALDAAVLSIQQGNVCGRNSNDTSSYEFDLKDEA